MSIGLHLEQEFVVRLELVLPEALSRASNAQIHEYFRAHARAHARLFAEKTIETLHPEEGI